SKQKEDAKSLQLPIYLLLVNGCQKRVVTKASYWYLELSDELEEKELPDIEEARSQVLKIAKQIKLARTFNRFSCPHKGCRQCKPFEMVLSGEAEFVGEDGYRRDIYMIDHSKSDEDESEIL
ncbi:hypothetical protein C5B42_04565, partial [Candidatus Cerribacteria bacterium 'Amazon FNV 2010 28 9']